MKLLASILILLMFVMAFAPCGDATEMGMTQQAEQISEVSIKGAVNFEHETEKQQKEECSPICPCQCCPSIDSDTVGLPELAIFTPLAHTMETKNSFSSVISFLIWSPPQLLS